jgi:hypothetical protein
VIDKKIIRKKNGKILKPKNWQPPQLAQFLNK